MSRFLDAFIDLTLDEYVPGHASGTRLACAPVAIAEMPASDLIDPADVLDDNGDETASPEAPPRATYVPAIRRFAPPRRG